ncbi:hypothetical protein A7985_07070 [Pseudoalteromonas luteoviolacea]|uniref:Uncharacterized protein n=1 Tax=Pseudoalteromonas luteoviolacea TaxID=43657 RepID=A0A1C0TWK1_9GAMM|nr:hypothetical protein [Pseudoalteromonas luteoviolacea]OCQ23696.1 hypothetical protein A7985_07070 [Pseudoalteromonas luteoviolacea]
MADDNANSQDEKPRLITRFRLVGLSIFGALAACVPLFGEGYISNAMNYFVTGGYKPEAVISTNNEQGVFQLLDTVVFDGKKSTAGAGSLSQITSHHLTLHFQNDIIASCEADTCSHTLTKPGVYDIELTIQTNGPFHDQDNESAKTTIFVRDKTIEKTQLVETDLDIKKIIAALIAEYANSEKKLLEDLNYRGLSEQLNNPYLALQAWENLEVYKTQSIVLGHNNFAQSMAALKMALTSIDSLSVQQNYYLTEHQRHWKHVEEEANKVLCSLEPALMSCSNEDQNNIKKTADNVDDDTTPPSDNNDEKHAGTQHNSSGDPNLKNAKPLEFATLKPIKLPTANDIKEFMQIYFLTKKAGGNFAFKTFDSMPTGPMFGEQLSPDLVQQEPFIVTLKKRTFFGRYLWFKITRPTLASSNNQSGEIWYSWENINTESYQSCEQTLKADSNAAEAPVTSQIYDLNKNRRFCHEWHGTNIKLNKGKPYCISAKAAENHPISLNADTKNTTVNGLPIDQSNDNDSFLHNKQNQSVNIGKLIGTIGTRNGIFEIGEQLSFIAENTGVLYLNLNDRSPEDNKGKVSYSIMDTLCEG